MDIPNTKVASLLGEFQLGDFLLSTSTVSYNLQKLGSGDPTNDDLNMH